MTEYRLLIDGRLVAGDMTMEVVNPANEQVLALAPRASGAQLDAAVTAAKAAFPAWAARPIEDRRVLILGIADRIEAEAEGLARLLTQEQGKPLPEAQAEILYTCAFIRHLAGYDLPVKVIEDNESRLVRQFRKPLGVVGAIIPWNFPVLIVAFKMPLALLAGNTMVIKPAPTTPLTTLRLGEIMAELLPAVVVNIVTDQNDLGAALTAHPDVVRHPRRRGAPGAPGRAVRRSVPDRGGPRPVRARRRAGAHGTGDDHGVRLRGAGPPGRRPARPGRARGHLGHVVVPAG